MAKSSKKWRGEAQWTGGWDKEDFVDELHARSWGIESLLRGAVAVDIYNPSGELVETLQEDVGLAENPGQFSCAEIADLLDSDDVCPYCNCTDCRDDYGCDGRLGDIDNLISNGYTD